MARFGRVHSVLRYVTLGAAVFGALWGADPHVGHVLLKGLLAWGLLSLPAGLLVGHYCALGDEPAR